MPLLTKDEVRKYAFRFGKIYFATCDEGDCSALLRESDIYVVKKSARRTDGLTFLAPIELERRCLCCQEILYPRKVVEEVSVKGAGRGSKKVSQAEASKLSVNPMIRRAVISLLKKLAPKEGILTSDLMLKLRKRKAIRELKPKEIRDTLRAMRKLKLARVKAKKWSLIAEKAGKRKKKKSKKVAKIA